MALTRAQLIAGDTFEGPVLQDEVQGVKQGAGVTIDLDGTINFSASTASGVVRLNSDSAFNGYVWPTLTGPPPSGTVLQSDGAGGLSWELSGSLIQAGLGINLSVVAPNDVLKLQTPVRTGPPNAGSLPSEAIDGSLYWDNTQGLLFIRYNDGTSTQWVQVIPSGGGGGTLTSITAGTGLTGGTINTSGTIALATATTSTLGGVKIGSNLSIAGDGTLSATAGVTSITAGTGLTGGTINTSGTVALAPATTTTLGGVIAGSNLSIAGDGTLSASYTATAPIKITGSVISLDIGLGNLQDGGFLKAATSVRTGPPAAGPGQLQAVDGSLYWDNTQGLLFIRYNDGTSTQWVQVTPVTPAPTGFTGTFLSQGGQTVTVLDGIIQAVS